MPQQWLPQNLMPNNLANKLSSFPSYASAFKLSSFPKELSSFAYSLSKNWMYKFSSFA